jgi:hypothetical protein
VVVVKLESIGGTAPVDKKAEQQKAAAQAAA